MACGLMTSTRATRFSGSLDETVPSPISLTTCEFSPQVASLEDRASATGLWPLPLAPPLVRPRALVRPTALRTHPEPHDNSTPEPVARLHRTAPWCQIVWRQIDCRQIDWPMIDWPRSNSSGPDQRLSSGPTSEPNASIWSHSSPAERLDEPDLDVGHTQSDEPTYRLPRSPRAHR